MPAVVLVGQTPKAAAAVVAVEQAGQLRPLPLRPPRQGIAYFEDCRPRRRQRRLSQVHFDRFGHGLRGRLYNPLPQGRTRGFLEALVGGPIEW